MEADFNKLSNYTLLTENSELKRNLSLITKQLLEKIEFLKTNRTIDDQSLIILLIAYTILIVSSAIGNGMVCLTLLRKPHMRTERNLFIGNLAVSDLILCLFTMPFSLLEIVLKYWPLGIIPCKLVAGLEATSIYVSTFSIIAIALDRYNVIIKSRPKRCKPLRLFTLLASIWFLAIWLAIPLFYYRNLTKEDVRERIKREFPNLDELNNMPNVTVELCHEEWPIRNGRAIYSIFSIIVQYIVPIILLCVAYLQIYRKLQVRLKQKSARTQLAENKAHDRARTQRTNLLLISIAIIFGLSWLPLNILNIVCDHFIIFDNPAHFRIAFACCHMMGMSSACSNPLLYGWLNDNFKKEFLSIFAICTRQTGTINAGRNSNLAETCTELGGQSFEIQNQNTLITPVSKEPGLGVNLQTVMGENKLCLKNAPRKYLMVDYFDNANSVSINSTCKRTGKSLVYIAKSIDKDTNNNTDQINNQDNSDLGSHLNDGKSNKFPNRLSQVNLAKKLKKRKFTKKNKNNGIN